MAKDSGDHKKHTESYVTGELFLQVLAAWTCVSAVSDTECVYWSNITHPLYQLVDWMGAAPVIKTTNSVLTTGS